MHGREGAASVTCHSKARTGRCLRTNKTLHLKTSLHLLFPRSDRGICGREESDRVTTNSGEFRESAGCDAGDTTGDTTGATVPCILINTDRRMRRAPFLSWPDDPESYCGYKLVRTPLCTCSLNPQSAICNLGTHALDLCVCCRPPLWPLWLGNNTLFDVLWVRPSMERLTNCPLPLMMTVMMMMLIILLWGMDQLTRNWTIRIPRSQIGISESRDQHLSRRP